MAGSSRAPTIRSIQTLMSLLMLGVIGVGIAVVFLQPDWEPIDSQQAQLMLFVLAGLPFVAFLIYRYVRKRAIRRLGQRHQQSRAEVRHGLIPPELMLVALVGGFLAEGLGLFGGILFLLSGQWLALLAPALAIILIGIQIPAKESIETILRSERERA